MEILEIAQQLQANAYPGRGIILGRSASNRFAVLAYFIISAKRKTASGQKPIILPKWKILL